MQEVNGFRLLTWRIGRSQVGQAYIEYVVLGTIAVGVVMATVVLFGHAIGQLFNHIVDQIRTGA